ncbi:MAG: glycerol-3-phosphate 1-O-acyltransferase PlsY [Chloroflexota bacterium]
MIGASLLVAATLGYLFGSIPVGVIVARLWGNVDVRLMGSQHTGGTNVMRAVGKRAGLLVIVLDGLKAAVAVALATFVFGNKVVEVQGLLVHYQVAQVVAGLGAVVGHNWSVFLRFRGGRGVATFFGSWIPLFPVATLLGAEVLAIIALRTRYMSLASLSSIFATLALLATLTLRYDFPPIYLTYSVVSAGVVIYQHRDNIARLLSGRERRLGETAEAGS